MREVVVKIRRKKDNYRNGLFCRLSQVLTSTNRLVDTVDIVTFVIKNKVFWTKPKLDEEIHFLRKLNFKLVFRVTYA